MNNNPNRFPDKQNPCPTGNSGRRPPERSSDDRRRSGAAPLHGNVQERLNARRRAGETEPRMRQISRSAHPVPRRNVSAPKRHGTVLPLVWAGVLVAMIIVIIVIAVTRSGQPRVANHNDTLGAFAEQTEDTSTVATTEPPETAEVSYAERNTATVPFSSYLTFRNGILIDIENGTILEDRDGDAKMYPASMTKVMTLIVAYENAVSLDDTFTMTAEITDPLFKENASVAGFAVGEVITVRDMIYGLILPSGGDAAMGLAMKIAGSEEAFVALMNKKVAELGLVGTHFMNATGLHDDNHYSTCHDIALILEYAVKDDFMRTVLSSYKYTTSKTAEHPEGIELTSTVFSRMYGNESECVFILGGKTGYTLEAKNCLCTFATPFTPGEPESEIYARAPKYILVTAGSTDKWGPVFDAINIYKELGAAAAAAATETATSANTTAAEGSASGTAAASVRVYTAAPAQTTR